MIDGIVTYRPSKFGTSPGLHMEAQLEQAIAEDYNESKIKIRIEDVITSGVNIPRGQIIDITV